MMAIIARCIDTGFRNPSFLARHTFALRATAGAPE
jgi:hypothetical protein